MCWICIRCLAGVERERAEGVVDGRGWGSPRWLMTESSRAPHSVSSAYTTLGKRRDISSAWLLQKSHSVVLLMLNPKPPPLKIQITQLSFCFRSFSFLFTGPGDGKLAPVSHSCSWILMPLKVWHRAVIWDRSQWLRLWLFASWVSDGKWKPLQYLLFRFLFFLQPFLTHHYKSPTTRKQQWKNLHRLYLWRTRIMDQYGFSLFQVIQEPVSSHAIWHNKGHEDSRSTGVKFNLRFRGWENWSEIKMAK